MPLEYYLLLLGMALVTYLPRSVPLALLASRSLNPLLARWLSFVPAAVLAALLMPDVLSKDNTLFISTDNIFLLAAIPTALVAILTKSFFGTVLTGMAVTAGLRALL